MKIFISILLLGSTLFVNGQVKLIPAKKIVDSKWLKNQQYQMAWYAIKDTAKIEIGKVTTQIDVKKNRVTVITEVSLKRTQSPWIDSTIANTKDLNPVYHSSYNSQRDMILNFGKTVTGFYTDKTSKVTTIINDTTNSGYFDSNIYPVLIGWLPLEEGYKKDISIYDYNPKGKTGILKAMIRDVKKGTIESNKSGLHDVWVVTVSDEIGGEDAVSTYYIDIADRKLWKQELNAGARKMLMELIEE
ncbi:MAG: hypothetical protein WBP16_10225 [Ferruginibacter sp.]